MRRNNFAGTNVFADGSRRVSDYATAVVRNWAERSGAIFPAVTWRDHLKELIRKDDCLGEPSLEEHLDEARDRAEADGSRIKLFGKYEPDLWFEAPPDSHALIGLPELGVPFMVWCEIEDTSPLTREKLEWLSRIWWTADCSIGFDFAVFVFDRYGLCPRMLDLVSVRAAIRKQ